MKKIIAIVSLSTLLFSSFNSLSKGCHLLVMIGSGNDYRGYWFGNAPVSGSIDTLYCLPSLINDTIIIRVWDGSCQLMNIDWSKNGTFIGSFDSYIPINDTGLYHATVQDDNFSLSQFDIHIGYQACISTGLNELSINNSLTIFPSPVKLILNLKLNDIHEDILQISFYNSTGQLVLKTDVVKEQIDVSSWQNGIYLAVIEAESGKCFYSKFFKED